MEVKKITPFLWFNDQAEEAANLYCSIFKRSTILQSSPMMAVFELEGQRFMAANFGPQFQFNEATSFFVSCQDQEEVDYLWQKLTANGGKEGRCGWLKDRFGVSWQIVPAAFGQLAGGDPVKSQRMFAAMQQMNKLDMEKLQQAYDGN